MRVLKQEKLLLIYDRGDPSLKIMQQHQHLDVDFLFRVQERAYKKLWERVSAGEYDFDSVIETQGGSQAVRVIAIPLRNGKMQILITSLFDRDRFTQEDISKIYCLRWHREECYK
ncbi:MAG: transposase, partial [Proteobacteria bacterium]|nr:transposase [Pseudomonadota bacterium]